MKKIVKKLLSEKMWNRITPPFHLLMAIFANVVYGFPGNRLKVIGITGTNGKSTTAFLLAKILEQAGYKVGLSSTVKFKIADQEWVNDTNKTVLGRFGLPKLMSRMVKADCDFAIIEVTSHALVQHRVWGIPFDVVVFTNLAPEHLDYHGTLDEYKKAKGKLFLMLNSKKKGLAKTSIVNADDPEFPYYHDFQAERKFVFGLNKNQLEQKEGFFADDIKLTVGGTTFRLSYPEGEIMVGTRLWGRFNVSNTLAALASAYSVGVSAATAAEALKESEGVSGRMEVIGEELPFRVIVDYAHTPDAFEALFSTIKELSPTSRIIAVFGATGSRDKSKRPKLGRVASEYADIVILTNEEPYDENPEDIIKEVAAGVPEDKKNSNFYIIPDRREAIDKAISLANAGDIITITGMGHQKYAVFGDRKIPWNDKKAVEEALEKKSNSRS